MKKKNVPAGKDELEPEYDFSKMKKVGQGLYARDYKKGTNLVLLAPDVAKVFSDEDSVNEALRLLIKTAKLSVTK